MTVSSLIHPIRLLKKIDPSNHTDNHEKHQTHNSIKKQHSKDFGDAMQQALSKDNPVFIEDEIEKKKLKTKLQKDSYLNRMALEYKLNQR